MVRAENVAVPETLDDLTKPAYDGTLVVENPATSSPGLAFVLATIARYGEDGWRDYWSKLRGNGVRVVDDWTTAFEGNFTQGGNDGTYPLVVSYASSPPVAVYFSKPQPDYLADRHAARLLLPTSGARGSAHRYRAPRRSTQAGELHALEALPGGHPAPDVRVPGAGGHPLPPVFEKFADVPAEPLSLPARDIGANREEWIAQWTETVLR